MIQNTGKSQIFIMLKKTMLDLNVETYFTISQCESLKFYSKNFTKVNFTYLTLTQSTTAILLSTQTHHCLKYDGKIFWCNFITVQT